MWGILAAKALQRPEDEKRCRCACDCKREATRKKQGLKLCDRCYRDTFYFSDKPIWQ